MLMGLKDVLNLARTPEKREEMKKLLLKLLLEERRDEDIDLSDMPEVTDFHALNLSNLVSMKCAQRISDSKLNSN